MTYSTSTPQARLPQASLMVPGAFNMFGTTTTSTTSGANTANQACYMPFVMPYTATLLAMSFAVTSGTNNHDMGIYSADATLLTSRGSTASTAAAVNTWTLSTAKQVVLQEGTLYFTAHCTAGTVAFLKWTTSSVINPRMGRMIQANGAVALQSTATFAPALTNSLCPFILLTFDK